jgi:prepilin-type N-terminal cleavage/methylation domain-containing protein
MTRRSRTGLTLVELLVVIAVIAILASLLFPAIMQARGAGRKAQCESNLKQLAQAVQSFHHRNDCLPVYWGQMGASSNKVGGWLFHMLPDLDQQTAFDSVPGTPTGMTSGIVATTEVVSTGKMLPAIPASADYSPGVWKEIVTGSTTAVVNGSQQTIVETEWVLEGRKGTPGLPERPETITRTVFTPVNNPLLLFDIRSEYYALGRQLTLPLLNDPEDIGAFRSPSLATTGTLDASNQQLTNYQANAHVFLQFQPRVTWEVVRNPGAAVSGQWIILKNGMRALSPGFTSKEAATAVLLSGVGFDDTGRANSGFGPSGTAAFADAGRFLPGQGNNLWRHWDASRAGPPGRTLHHVTV